MPKRIVIIQGHPDSQTRHYGHALADEYAKGAEDSGYEVRRIEVAQLDFPFLRKKEDFEKSELPVALAPAVEAITWANHLVILYPLWLGSMPALLKAFLEQVFRPGVAFEYQRSGGMPRKLLTGKVCSHRCHNGDAGVRLPMGFSRPQSQELTAQHPRVLRHPAHQEHSDRKHRRDD